MFHSFKRLFALSLAVASLTSAAAVPGTDLEVRQDGCASGVHMMIAGGCTLPCAYDQVSLLRTLVSNITTAFPGSDYYLLPYDGSQFQAAVSTPVLVAAAIDYFNTCPNTPVVFIGYSLGGIIVMNSLCGNIDPKYSKHVLGAIAYGEETWRYPMPYDVGSCTNSAPLYPRNNTAQCLPWAPVIQSYCDAADPKCCAGGWNQWTHYGYDDGYDVIATNFLRSRLPTYNLTTSSSSSSSVALSTSTSTSTATSTVTTTETTSISTTTTTESTSTTTTDAADPTTTTTTTSSTTDAAADPTTTVSTTVSTTTASTTTTTVPVVPVSATDSTSSTTPATPASVSSTDGTAAVTPATTSAKVIPTPVATVSSYFSLPAGSSAVNNPIPNSAILFSSAVQESILSSGAAASATAAGTATGSVAISSATASVTAYTGSASSLVIPGFVYVQWACKVWRSAASLVL